MHCLWQRAILVPRQLQFPGYTSGQLKVPSSEISQTYCQPNADNWELPEMVSTNQHATSTSSSKAFVCIYVYACVCGESHILFAFEMLGP